jgi:CMP-N,N'-diacetyllegionaminic acid synthase
MKILAVVTARGGSKRLPGKNILPLAGKPLIGWSIDVAKNIPEICNILVSTDDGKIANVARGYGALVPWLRPAELAGDFSSSVDVVLHAVEWYEQNHGSIDGVLLLQPTSPFRTRDTLINAINLFKQSNFNTVVAVSLARSHPRRCFEIKNSNLYPIYEDPKEGIARSQDLSKIYEVNGSLYLISPNILREKQSFYARDAKALVVESPIESIDIDTAWDWELAKLLSSALTKI